jgi:hypothetical protein
MRGFQKWACWIENVCQSVGFEFRTLGDEFKKFPSEVSVSDFKIRGEIRDQPV